MTHDRKPALLAVGFGTLHAAIALSVASWPLAYGTVGEQAMVDDVQIYFRYASQIVEGQVPYHDFRVEYPLLALPFFVLPRLLTARFATYQTLFAIELLLANGLTLYLLARTLSRRLTTAGLVGRLVWYTLDFAILCPMTVCRFDLLVMAWTFAAAVAWSSGRAGLGGVLAGSGAHLKIVPGVIAAVGLATPDDARVGARRRGLIGLVATLAIGLAIMVGLGGRNVTSSLVYHVKRGVEIGSLHAGLMMVAAWVFVAPLSWGYINHSAEVLTPWSRYVSKLAFPVQAAGVLAPAWKVLRGQPHDPMRYHAAAVLGFVAFGKVLSPQYVIWLIPFLAVLDGPIGTLARLLFLAACLLTTWIYPWEFSNLLDFTPWSVTLLNARNFVLVGLWALLTFGLNSKRAPA